MLESFIQWVDRQLVDPENERKLAEAIARCKHGKKSWVWLGGVMTNTARCQACGKEFTPSTMKQDKSQ